MWLQICFDYAGNIRIPCSSTDANAGTTSSSL